MNEQQYVTVEAYCDGWKVILPDGVQFSWNHNDDDLGVNDIKAMLEHIGFNVQLEEVY